MQIGAVYPQIELSGDTQALDRIGRGVEALGYAHLLMYDHVMGVELDGRTPPLVGPYTDKDPFHDPLVAFAYLSAVTTKIELVTGILILPQRQTALVAKQATDIDLLSKGRLRLGVGTGWNSVEYDALGQSFKDRGARLTEQISLLRELWSNPLVSFDGRFDHIERANINPRPDRLIPIYCGGFAEPAYKRAAKLADGFIFAAPLESGTLQGWQRVRELLEAEGRPVEGFGAHFILMGESGSGSDPKTTVDALRRWRDVGGTHASIVTMGMGFTTADQHLDYLAEIKSRWDAD